MASSAGTKCPVCGKSIAVGLVSQNLIQHEDKTGQRCPGSGQAPVVSAARAAAASRSGGRASSGSSTSGSSAANRSSPATRGSLTVRKVEVDPEALRERQERSERLRQERAAAARERNEVNVSYFDEPGV
ncbi:hypothetical protein ACEXOS_007485 [Herbiconiux sp. P16]|uniref:hypothetical protein n=1 Tax=Herbiconiux wuyangfengii TaxID=3342794 RepID=UPI0035BC05F7